MSKQRPCPDCQAKGKFSFMLYSKKFGCYICPSCKGSFVPGEKDDDYAKKVFEDEIKDLMQEKYKSNLPTKEPIPAGRAGKGGGSKIKGTGKKGQMKKKPLSQIYREL